MANTAQIYTLEAQGIRLQMDADGQLWTLSNKYTGHGYINLRRRSLWKLVLADDKNVIQPAYAGDLPGKVTVRPDGLDICHDEVMLESGQRVPVQVLVRIRLQGDNETQWEIEV